MKLSKRINAVTEADGGGWDVFYRARQMVVAGEDVVELTIGEHDIRTDPIILDEMNRAAKAGHTGYAMVPGTNELRELVAQRVTERTGTRTTRDNVIITSGGQAALLASHHAVCDEGDTALFCDPYYATYPGTISAVGATPKPVLTDPQRGFQPEKQAIMAAANDAVSLLINTPNNPSGVVYGPETIAEICGACQEADLWLISDEVYDTQIWTGKHISPRSLPDMAARTLVIGSMSKSHAMTGSRIGWVIAPEAVIEHLISLSTHTTYGVPGYIQDAAAFALSQGAALEEKVAAPFRRRREKAMALLADQNLIRAVPAEGAMYLMLDIRATRLSGENFAHRLLAERRVAVMPGESFGRAASGHIRVALTVEDEKLLSALSDLIEFATGVTK